jgi:hypothetical protein
MTHKQPISAQFSSSLAHLSVRPKPGRRWHRHRDDGCGRASGVFKIPEITESRARRGNRIDRCGLAARVVTPSSVRAARSPGPRPAEATGAVVEAGGPTLDAADSRLAPSTGHRQHWRSLLTGLIMVSTLLPLALVRFG